MQTYICRYCGKTDEVYQFRSRFPNVCLDCYRDCVHKKGRTTNAKYLRLRYNAKKQGVPMTLSKEDFSLIQLLDCHYCGLPVAGRSSIEAKDNTGSGLDRKIPGAGYTPDNVVPSCFLCNRTKSDWFSYAEMLELGQAIRAVLDKRPIRLS